MRESITFSESGRQCVTVGIVTEDAFENPEKFSVVLSTLDERIEVKRNFATVYILQHGG